MQRPRRVVLLVRGCISTIKAVTETLELRVSLRPSKGEAEKLGPFNASPSFYWVDNPHVAAGARGQPKKQGRGGIVEDEAEKRLCLSKFAVIQRHERESPSSSFPSYLQLCKEQFLNAVEQLRATLERRKPIGQQSATALQPSDVGQV